MNIQESKKEKDALNNRAVIVRGLKSRGISAELMAVDIKALYAILFAGVSVAIPVILVTSFFAYQGYDAFKGTSAAINPGRLFREVLKR